MTAMGFWVNIYPTFANPHAWLDKIKISVEDKYPTATKAKALDLPTKYKPMNNTYISHGRISGKYLSKESAPTTDIKSDVMMMYSNSDKYDMAMKLVTQVSHYVNPALGDTPIFIPIALKKSNPTKFSHCLAKHNNFMQNH